MQRQNSQLDLFGGEASPAKNRNGHRRKQSSGNARSKAELTERIHSLEQCLQKMASRMEQMETVLLEVHNAATTQQTVKEAYTTHEVAKILGRKPYTVREWCRLQRVNAEKALCGRGCEEEWRISHEELLRIQNEGLLPVPERY